MFGYTLTIHCRIITVPALTSSPSAGLLLGGVSRGEEFTERRMGIVSSSTFYGKHKKIRIVTVKNQKGLEMELK